MGETRVATADDLQAVVGLATAGLTEQREERGGALWAIRESRSVPFELSLRESISDPDREIFVACVDNVVLGYVVVRAEHLRSGDALGVIEDIHVDAEARMVGLGEALMALVVSWCELRDCVGVDALVLPGNRATKNFFETLGFKARLLTVHRPLR
ncbi:MAG: GNAT family N-acetyltransferase [Actinomycetia bacterium]|nr:GNAT family N-acetyltransferase [Actinomycetes bacterium]MCP4959310.1 GNAT family N-acetyltransferase [Actinomycetes bacterium]